MKLPKRSQLSRERFLITNEAKRLIRAQGRRQHRSPNHVIRNLLVKFKANPRAIEWDPDDPNWWGQIVTNMAIKYLRVN